VADPVELVIGQSHGPVQRLPVGAVVVRVPVARSLLGCGHGRTLLRGGIRPRNGGSAGSIMRASTGLATVRTLFNDHRLNWPVTLSTICIMTNGTSRVIAHDPLRPIAPARSTAAGIADRSSWLELPQSSCWNCRL